jgi:hypothetical protein
MPGLFLFFSLVPGIYPRSSQMLGKHWTPLAIPQSLNCGLMKPTIGVSPIILALRRLSQDLSLRPVWATWWDPASNGWKRANMVEILGIHVWKWNNETCWSSTFVNVTVYPRYNYNMLITEKKKSWEEGLWGLVGGIWRGWHWLHIGWRKGPSSWASLPPNSHTLPNTITNQGVMSSGVSILCELSVAPWSLALSHRSFSPCQVTWISKQTCCLLGEEGFLCKLGLQ